MASWIEKGASIFIPFRNGQSIFDSQLKPRMYKTIRAFERSFPKMDVGMDGVELVEYAPVVHGRWIEVRNKYNEKVGEKCSVCGRRVKNMGENYCPKCGAMMDGDPHADGA